MTQTSDAGKGKAYGNPRPEPAWLEVRTVNPRVTFSELFYIAVRDGKESIRHRTCRVRPDGTEKVLQDIHYMAAGPSGDGGGTEEQEAHLVSVLHKIEASVRKDVSPDDGFETVIRASWDEPGMEGGE